MTEANVGDYNHIMKSVFSTLIAKNIYIYIPNKMLVI